MKNLELIEITNEQLNKMKNIQLDILKDVDKVCKELNLTYYLCAGTLLGAVRHGGFIPWDDDIDIQMPRKDYNLFIEKAQKLLKKNHIISSYKTEPAFIGDFFKIVDNNTTFVEVSTRKRNITKGVYIDVFPIDGIPENKFKKFFYCFKISLLKQRISNGYCLNELYEKRSTKGKIYNFLSGFLTFFMSPEKATKKLNIYLTKNDFCNSKFVIVESKYKRLYKREIFEKPSEIKFENLLFYAPTDVKGYLEKQYGDNYMTPPPVEKQISHHFCCELKLGD